MRKKILILGSGIAAHVVASELCHHYDVTILTKETKSHNNSLKAQGGIAAALSIDDSWQQHVQDTIKAGSYYNDNNAVEFLCKNGKKEILTLTEQIAFDCTPYGELSLGKEGAHSTRRIVRAGGDQIGVHLMNYYANQIQENVHMIENEMAIELVIEDNQLTGVITIDTNNNCKQYEADDVVIATGGCGNLFATTSNDKSVTGDGIALAYRAGALIRDMEFIQFHPTMLPSGGLISEAVRGEGGFLVDEQNMRFMDAYSELGDLASRDIVARAIHQEKQKGHSIYLNISEIQEFEIRFPQITSICEESNINWQEGLIPITPGAHFLMGGIATDMNGETSIPHLYAVGEVACSGVHGANRLASNSLLEGIVFAKQVAHTIRTKTVFEKQTIPKMTTKYKECSLPSLSILQEKMMQYCGIERNTIELKQLITWLERYILPLPSILQKSRQEIELYHCYTTAWLIATSAYRRKASIGAHYLIDGEKSFSSQPIYRQNQELGMEVFS